MSEHRGRRQLWTAALIVAPGAAAVFSTAMAWAVDAVPETATPTYTPRSSAATPTDLAALKHSVDADAQRVRQLQQTLATLRGQLAHTTPQAGATASLPASGAGDASTAASRPGAAAASAATPGASAAAPPPAPARNRPAPAPTPSVAPTPSTAPTTSQPAPSSAPPPVHTSTGAS